MCQDLVKLKLEVQKANRLTENLLFHTFSKIVRRHIVTLTMNSESVIKGFDIFKYKPASITK